MKNDWKSMLSSELSLPTLAKQVSTAWWQVAANGELLDLPPSQSQESSLFILAHDDFGNWKWPFIESLFTLHCLQVGESCPHLSAFHLSLSELVRERTRLGQAKRGNDFFLFRERVLLSHSVGKDWIVWKVVWLSGVLCKLFTDWKSYLIVSVWHLSTWQVSDVGVMHLILGCPLLLEVHVTNCSALSPEIRKAVALQMPWITFVAS